MRLLASLLLLTVVLNAQTITIAPAPVDRATLVVEFDLAEDTTRLIIATKADGTSLPVQVEDSGKACFVVGFLRASESLTLSLSKVDTPVVESVRLRPGVDGMVLSAAGAEVLNFRTDKTKKPRADIKDEILRAGYLHPVRSPPVPS